MWCCMPTPANCQLSGKVATQHTVAFNADARHACVVLVLVLVVMLLVTGHTLCAIVMFMLMCMLMLVMVFLQAARTQEQLEFSSVGRLNGRRWPAGHSTLLMTIPSQLNTTVPAVLPNPRQGGRGWLLASAVIQEHAMPAVAAAHMVAFCTLCAVCVVVCMVVVVVMVM